MHKFCVRFFLLLSIFITYGASALTLPEALSLAKQHPALELARQSIEIKQLGVQFYKTRGPAELSLVTEKLGGKGGSGVRELVLEYSVPLGNRALNEAQRSLAQRELEAEIVAEKSLEKAIFNATAKAFNRALILKELALQTQEDAIKAKELVEAANHLVEAGVAPETDVFQAEIALKQAELELIRLEGEYEATIGDLALAMGSPEPFAPELQLEGVFTEQLQLPSLKCLEGLAFELNPELLALEASIKVEEAELENIKAENKRTYQILTGAEYEHEEKNKTFSVGVSAELPHKRDNLRDRRIKEKQIQVLSLEIANLKRELRLNLSKAQNQLINLQSQIVKLRQESVPNAERLLELSTEEYTLGKAGQTVMVLAQRELLELKKELLERVDSLYEGLSELEILTGKPLYIETCEGAKSSKTNCCKKDK